MNGYDNSNVTYCSCNLICHLYLCWINVHKARQTEHSIADDNFWYNAVCCIVLELEYKFQYSDECPRLFTMQHVAMNHLSVILHLDKGNE